MWAHLCREGAQTNEQGRAKKRGHTIVLGTIFKARAQGVILADTKEKGAHKFKGGAITKESSRLSLRGASPLYQVPLFHFLFVAFA